MNTFKLDNNIVLQELDNDYFVIDLENEKTYKVNKEGYIILESIIDEYKNILQIYQTLGGNINNINSEDLEYIKSFILYLQEINILLVK